MSLNNEMGNKSCIRFNGMLHGSESEWTTDTCIHMGEFEKTMLSEISWMWKEYILYDSIYVKVKTGKSYGLRS